MDGSDYATIIADTQSSGDTSLLQDYAFKPVQARSVRINAHGNTTNDWNSTTEVVPAGCGVAIEAPDESVLTEKPGSGLFGLAPEKTPGKIVDLTGRHVTTPADDDGDGTSDSVHVNELAAGWTDPATGGMVFRVTPAGAKTSANTSCTRKARSGAS